MLGSRVGIKQLFAALVFDKHLGRTKFPKGTSIHFTDVDQQKGCKSVIECILQHHKAVAHLLGKVSDTDCSGRKVSSWLLYFSG